MDENQNTNEEVHPQQVPETKVNAESPKVEKSTLPLEVKDERTGNPQPGTQISLATGTIPQTETMEVHKHPHHITHTKKWSEYLLEFAMIFFAVFLGFVAENIRESAVESRREKEYIRSMIEDLKIDTAKIMGYARTRSKKNKMMDTLALLLVSGDNKKNGSDIYYLARYVTVNFPLITSDGTLQQLKNSGSLRLIKKQAIVDSILKYDGNVKYLEYLNLETRQIENTFREIAGEAFDSRFFNFIYAGIAKKPTGNPQLLTTSRPVLNKIAIQVRYEAIGLERDAQNAYSLDVKAARLLKLLKTEYHL